MSFRAGGQARPEEGELARGRMEAGKGIQAEATARVNPLRWEKALPISVTHCRPECLGRHKARGKRG